MITDYQLWFNTYGTPQAETAVDTHVSDNVYDTKKVDKHIIEAGYFVFRLATAITGTGETFDIQLVCSAAAALTTPTILWSSGVLAEATIEAWTANSIVYAIKMPPHIPLRYLGVLYIIGSAVFATGSWEAFITPDVRFLIPNDPHATS